MITRSISVVLGFSIGFAMMAGPVRSETWNCEARGFSSLYGHRVLVPFDVRLPSGEFEIRPMYYTVELAADFSIGVWTFEEQQIEVPLESCESRLGRPCSGGHYYTDGAGYSVTLRDDGSRFATAIHPVSENYMIEGHCSVAPTEASED